MEKKWERELENNNSCEKIEVGLWVTNKVVKKVEWKVTAITSCIVRDATFVFI